jgi:transcriptional regulator with XRE-family HTH domain
MIEEESRPAHVEFWVSETAYERRPGKRMQPSTADNFPGSPDARGLTEYLKQNPAALAPALRELRLRKGWSTAEAARQADISTQLWEAWEAASAEEVSVQNLGQALTKLSWIRDTEAMLSGSSEPEGQLGADRAETELWLAYERDTFWIDAADESLELRTADARKAWQAVDRAVLGIDDPEVLQRKLEAMKAEVEQAESTFGGFLGLRRQWSQKSVEEMARKAGVDVATWQAWEAGEVLPSVTEVEALGHRIYVSSTARARMLEIRKAMAP